MISDPADLAGLEVHVRQSSSFFETLLGISGDLQAEGLESIRLNSADELLESEDLLEMVNAGLIPATVVDKHMADFWAQVFPGIRIHSELPLREGGGVAWAIRKGSPELKTALDRFAGEHRQGTLLGNITLRRYLADVDYVANPTVGEAQARFDEALPVFQRFANEYQLDPLMLLALAYQESGLDQSVESHVGAQGIMQLMPTTAADPNVGIPDISTMENNVHAGTKYLRFLLDRYFADEPLDELNEHFFAFAAYNAGPARVARLRAEAEELGLDPNLWFRNVEQVAARRIGRETVQYVSNIYKFYLAYSHLGTGPVQPGPHG
jgi:membrane-bound lytic murein transglycosylase MltF